MGLIYGYLFVVTSFLLNTHAHDRRYHGVAYHLRNISLNGQVLHINGRPVCNEGFSERDAAVVCRQMGNDSSHVNIIYNNTKRANTSLIGEGCRGSETRLQECYFGIKIGCRRTIPVSIICNKGRDYMKQETKVKVLPSTNIRVYRGTTVTVTCLAEGRYMPSQYWYTWTLANGTGVGSSPSVSLRLDETFPIRTKLTCNVYVRDQLSVTASIDLQVLGDPPPLRRSYHLNVGEWLDLDNSCSPGCSCSWRKVIDRVDLESSYETSCKMPITDRSQTGLYIVNRTNYLSVTQGEPRKGISVDVIKIQVSDKPTVECPPQQYVIRSSKSHQMCRFQSPWYIKNCTGDPQPSCTNCSIETDETHNSGNYTCEVGYFNKHQNQSNSTIYKIRVDIMDTNWTVSVMTGSNIDLNSPNCSAAQANNYTWQILRDDGSVTRNYSQFNVTKSANYVGSSQKDEKILLKLEVLHEPQVTCDKKLSYPLGTRVRLSCSVDAVPESSHITWTRDDGKVIRNTTSDTWILEDLGMTDRGSYTCTAYNTMVDCYNETRDGNGSCTITLDVYVESDKRTVTVVASVLSLLVVGLMIVVGVLSGFLHAARREERRRNKPTKMLPLLTAPKQVKGVPPSDIYENA